MTLHYSIFLTFACVSKYSMLVFNNICSGEFHESKLKLRINTLLMKNKDDLPLQIS